MPADHMNWYTKSVSEFELNILDVIDGPLEPLPLLKRVDLNSRSLWEVISTKKVLFLRTQNILIRSHPLYWDLVSSAPADSDPGIHVVESARPQREVRVFFCRLFCGNIRWLEHFLTCPHPFSTRLDSPGGEGSVLPCISVHLGLREFPLQLGHLRLKYLETCRTFSHGSWSLLMVAE